MAGNNLSPEKKRFLAAFSVMCKAFNEPIDPEKMRIYYQFLAEEFSIEQMEIGVKNAIKSSRFFPRIADIRAAIPGACLSSEERAALAWGEFQEEFRTSYTDGCRARSEWRDPLIPHAIARLGGWSAVREWPADLTWKRKDFIATHTALQKEAPPALPGGTGEAMQQLISGIGSLK